LRFDDISEPFVRKIEDLLLDWFASAVAGHGTRPVQTFARFAQACWQRFKDFVVLCRHGS
jgi:2-methylcitrate dehydratase PrpD